MSGLTPEMTRRMLNAASLAIVERAGEDAVIADALGTFFAELGLDTDEWLLFVRSKSMMMGQDFADEHDGAPVEILLAAAIAISLGEGFMLGVEFTRAQRRFQAAMQ